MAVKTRSATRKLQTSAFNLSPRTPKHNTGKSWLYNHSNKGNCGHSLPFPTPSQLNPGPQMHYEPWKVTDNMVPEGTRLQLGEGRDPYLPIIFEVAKEHPLVPRELYKIINRVLVIPWPAGDQGYNRFFYNKVKSELGVPRGPNGRMEQLGLSELVAGDIVFIRDPNISTESSKDLMDVYLVNPEAEWLDNGFLDELTQIRNETLGAREERSSTQVLFEKCHKRAIKIKGARCYSVGLNHQKPKNLVGPAAGGKVRGLLSEDEDTHIRSRQNLVKITIQAAMSSFRAWSKNNYEILKNIADLHNVPRIGTPDNVCFQAVQLNLATPKPHDSTDDLSSDLGWFGGMHFDQFDSVGGWTTMISHSDLPQGEGWEGGRFHIVELGLYTRLDNVVAISFSGLRLHGGTPPLAPANAEIPPWAYRWVSVLYPQGATLDGQVSMNIADNGDGHSATLSPIMKDVSSPKNKIEEDSDNGNEYDTDVLEIDEDSDLSLTADQSNYITQEINFATDGNLIMNPQSEIDFQARAAYQMALYREKQIPGSVSSSFEDFRKTFCSILRNGIEYKVCSWPLAPDGSQFIKPCTTADWSTLTPRQLVYVQWAEHCRLRSNVIPSTFRNFKPSGSGKFKKEKRKLCNQTRIALKKCTVRYSIAQQKRMKASLGEIVKTSRRKVQLVNFSSKIGLKPRKSHQKYTDKSTDIEMNNASTEANNYQAQASRNKSNLIQSATPIALAINAHRPDSKTEASYEFLVQWDDTMRSESWQSPEKICQLGFEAIYLEYCHSHHLTTSTAVEIEMTVSAGQDNSSPISENSSIKKQASTSRVPAPIRFLADLNKNGLTDAIDVFKAASDAKELQSVNIYAGSWSEINQTLSRIHIAMQEHPLEEETAILSQKTWPLIQVMRIRTRLHDADALLLRSAVMSAHYNLYRWLSHCLDTAMKQGKTSFWASRLSDAVSTALHDKSQAKHIFSSLDYLPDLDPAAKFEWTYSPLPRGVSVRDHNHHLCFAIFCSWLGIPSNNDHSVQTQFLNILCNSCSDPAVFLLEPVWKAYNDLSLIKSTSTQKSTRAPSGLDMKRFEDALSTHPIAGQNPSPEITALFQDLNNAYTCLLKGGSIAVSSSLHNASYSSHISASPNPTTSSPSAMTVTSNWMIEYSNWMVELAVALTENPAQKSSAQVYMLNDMDANCPFREFGTSRQKITCPHGPFSSDLICTRAGIFSALVFRGILFKTDLLKVTTHSGFFPSLDDFLNLITQYPGQSSTFYCHPGPYGATKGRTHLNAVKFWESSLQLHEKLSQDTQDFIGLIKFIAQSSTFPSFGRLGAYLLAVDLVYAGRIPWPSVQSVGKAIFFMKKGAFNALHKLGLIGEDANEVAVVSAFCEVYSFLDKDGKFSLVKDKVGFDVFVVEHSLCKISRDNVLDSRLLQR